MRADFFFRAETQRRPWSEQVKRPARCISLEVKRTTFPALIAAAHKAGMPTNSSRAGCFEIQTDAGIWMHKRQDFAARAWGKITQDTAVFIRWEDLP